MQANCFVKGWVKWAKLICKFSRNFGAEWHLLLRKQIPQHCLSTYKQQIYLFLFNRQAFSGFFLFFVLKLASNKFSKVRLKSSNSNYYAIESSPHYLSHCTAISNSISCQSIHSQKECLFCSLCNCYNINAEVTYLYLW